MIRAFYGVGVIRICWLAMRVFCVYYSIVTCYDPIESWPLYMCEDDPDKPTKLSRFNGLWTTVTVNFRIVPSRILECTAASQYEKMWIGGGHLALCMLVDKTFFFRWRCVCIRCSRSSRNDDCS